MVVPGYTPDYRIKSAEVAGLDFEWRDFICRHAIADENDDRITMRILAFRDEGSAQFE